MTLLFGIGLFIAGVIVGWIMSERVVMAAISIAAHKLGISDDTWKAVRDSVTNEDGRAFWKLVFKRKK